MSAALVKELRERTGLGLLECKKALAAADGDIDKAIEELKLTKEQQTQIEDIRFETEKASTEELSIEMIPFDRPRYRNGMTIIPWAWSEPKDS